VSKFLETYRELKPQFERLKDNVFLALKDLIRESDIPTFDVESRVKDEDSIRNKIISKSLTSPLEQIDDFCGIRVICYYQEDIEKICSIVESQFNVLLKENKQDELDDNQFGYSSFHYVITLKDEWLGHHSAKGLSGFKAEIQIRTMLMHSWAAISHKLLYKREKDIPSTLKRKMNRLSALIELADEQFNQLKNEKYEYNSNLTDDQSQFDSTGELNSDSLMALKSSYFNERITSDKEIPELLQEIRFAGLTLNQFVVEVEKCQSFLPDMEKEEAQRVHMELPLWGFGGVVRTILDLVSLSYFENRKLTLPEEVIDSRNKYRKVLESKT